MSFGVSQQCVCEDLRGQLRSMVSKEEEESTKVWKVYPSQLAAKGQSNARVATAPEKLFDFANADGREPKSKPPPPRHPDTSTSPKFLAVSLGR